MPSTATRAPATAGALTPPSPRPSASTAPDSRTTTSAPRPETRAAGGTGDTTRTDDAAGRPPIRRINAALFGIGLATFAMLFATQPLLPELAAAFGSRPDHVSWTVSGATVGLAVAVLPLSLLSERVGRRRMMTIGVLVALVLACLVPFAPSLTALTALRVLQGAALAAVPASAVAYLSEELDKRAMVGAVGLFIAGNSVGGMSGRILAGWTSEALGWRAALLAVAGLAAIGAALYVVLLPAARNFTPTPLRAREALGTVAHHLRNTLLLRLYAIGMLLMAAFSAVYTAVAFRLTEDPFGLSAGVAGTVFVIYLVGTCSSSMTGVTVTRLGRRGALYVGIGAITAGLVLSLTQNLTLLLLALVLITGGFFLGHAVASAAVGRAADRARAQASALYTVTYYGGASAGGVLGALTYHTAHWEGTVAFALVALLTAAGVTLYATLRSHSAQRLAAASH
ncbi:MFS transporter [Streptomyces bohaiensis]|uniref:MFS transporter n=1 Tax=Streptomyces bohaiensis TaxID=1431344 RepID=A0ABX1CAI4_9ACTN|nr:MFS transporter [Streptomyces bohaiensis]NJQ14605.1 MFS transporter [Streptomyces bohaiensis]